MYVFTYNRICMVIGRKWQKYDVDGNDSSAARTRHVIIMQARAAAGRGQRSTRHIDHVGVPKSGNVNGETIHAFGALGVKVWPSLRSRACKIKQSHSLTYSRLRMRTWVSVRIRRVLRPRARKATHSCLLTSAE